LRRLAELALVGIAAVWGLTFVMVQDAIAELPPLAFLAYRFVPAGLLVAVFSWTALRALGRDGWRAGLVMGVFLTAGYVFQTLGLQDTSASNAGFITGLFFFCRWLKRHRTHGGNVRAPLTFPEDPDSLPGCA